MNWSKVFKPAIYGLLVLMGILSITTPFFSHKDAYFVGEDYYINMVDSVDAQYGPYIKDLVQAERNKKAISEKKQYRETIKAIADSLSVLQTKADLSKDSTKKANIAQAINAFEMDKMTKEEAISGKYDISKLSPEDLAKKVATIKDTLTLEKYVVIVANQLRNPNNLTTIPSATIDQINVQKVNKQSSAGFILVGFVLIAIVIFLVLMEKNTIPLHKPAIKLVGMVVFFGAAVIIGSAAFGSLTDDIKFKEVSEARELEAREKLMQIKDLQVEFLSTNNRYCSAWDSLVNYAKHDSSQIIRYLVDKNDTAAVNNALRSGLPLKDTTYVPVDIKVYGQGHSVNLDSLPFVPYTAKQFELKINQFERNGRPVNVIEVKTKKKTYLDMLDIYPENFDEDLVIKFGSLAEPTTEGNW